MKGRLLTQAITKFLCGALFTALMIFLPAGTVRYPRGWLLMGILLIPMLLAGLVMYKKAPRLLESRLKAKEGEGEQRHVIALSGLMFLGGFAVSGLDFRFGWSGMPVGVSYGAAAVFLLAYLMYAEVLRENAYLSRTIELQEGQKVVDTGMYSLVRHPMYLATIPLFLTIPLVLGSWWGLLIFLPHPFLMARRIRNEEQVLRRGLEGYEEYTHRVKYRMIPFIR